MPLPFNTTKRLYDPAARYGDPSSVVHACAPRLCLPFFLTIMLVTVPTAVLLVLNPVLAAVAKDPGKVISCVCVPAAVIADPVVPATVGVMDPAVSADTVISIT